MTTIDDLIRAVEDNPENPIIAWMLTDELIGARDMTRTEADKRVAEVQLVAVQAREVRSAAEVMQKGTRSGQWLMNYARGYLGLRRRAPFTLFLVPGAEAPAHISPPDRPEDIPQPEATATVGARWVLDHWTQHVQQLRRDRRAAAARRRHSANV